MTSLGDGYCKIRAAKFTLHAGDARVKILHYRDETLHFKNTGRTKFNADVAPFAILFDNCNFRLFLFHNVSPIGIFNGLPSQDICCTRKIIRTTNSTGKRSTRNACTQTTHFGSRITKSIWIQQKLAVDSHRKTILHCYVRDSRHLPGILLGTRIRRAWRVHPASDQVR
jgi:hypothetical protein